jgi:hypothetical protein
MTEPEQPELTHESRCTCTHRYPYHDHGGACTLCVCLGFALAEQPVVRERTGPACTVCGAELLLVRDDRIVCERCRLAHPDAGAPIADAPGLADLREACRGCGFATALADGLCLGCRMAGRS